MKTKLFWGYLKILTWNTITLWTVERRELIENIEFKVPNTASESKEILFRVSMLKKMLFQFMFEIIKWICQLQLRRQTVPNYWCWIRQIFFDQYTCFITDVLVSKQKISYLLDFDQIAYMYHEDVVDKFH